jgi:hypothetical protein
LVKTQNEAKGMVANNLGPKGDWKNTERSEISRQEQGVQRLVHLLKCISNTQVIDVSILRNS